MALPTIPVPTAQVLLPLSQQTVSASAWRVSEEKLLLAAAQSNSAIEIQQALNQILTHVTQRANIESLPLADVEYLLLRVRMLSVDETVTRQYICQNDVNGKPCGATINVDIPLTDAKVETGEGHTKLLSLGPDVDVEMQYPTIREVALIMALPNPDDEKDLTLEDTLPVLQKCVKAITVGDEVYDPKDATAEEWSAFFDSWQSKHVDALLHFFSTMPTVTIRHPIECPKCHMQTTLIVRGIKELFL
jgi:hypothetical protein